MGVVADVALVETIEGVESTLWWGACHIAETKMPPKNQTIINHQSLAYLYSPTLINNILQYGYILMVQRESLDLCNVFKKLKHDSTTIACRNYW